ncbi:MAG TPA: S9 family peptidase [Roseiflexaceae bacterium]|nr:S9 family peptidase [Roseiflexaceae bacterium]
MTIDTTVALPLEAVVTYPLPGMAIPGAIAWSPDDRLISYLHSPDRGLTRQLYAFDTETGERRLLLAPADGGATEQNISLEEQLRRERLRQRELGVTQYAWARRSSRILVPLRGDIYVQDGPDAPLRKVVDSNGVPALNPQLSPDGSLVAYVQDSELYVVTADAPSTSSEAADAPRQLTSGARGTGKTNGLAEYVAQEEMGRREGFWWSRDGEWLAFEQVDETHIPIYRIVHQGKDATGEGAQEDHRYPFAGAPNAKVRLGVVPVSDADGTGEPIWMDLGDDEDIYLARVQWLPDGSLSAQIENRAQTTLDLVQFDPSSGERRDLLREESDVWINLHQSFRPLRSGAYAGGFIWASEREGFQHLYLYDRDRKLVRQLTSGEWMVDALAGVDEARGLVYFTGTRQNPLEAHLYAVSLAGGEPRKITVAAGKHAVVLDHACARYVDTHDSLTQPPTVTLRAIEDPSTGSGHSGALLATIFDERDPRVDALALDPPELVTLQSRDGVTLHGAIFRPPARAGAGPYPTIVQVYGGPHAQTVTNSWTMTVAMRAQYLRSQGFLVFLLDNRGSARRGLAFEGALKHDMGHVEVDDQVDGVRWLVAQGLADPARVGIYGWSYGGYMAVMCLARAPETFRVAVAGAPVTHWDGYDTHYTERYMGTPQSNPTGYVESSVLAHVDKITGKLMLIHGLIDENVHFRHTARLINALIKSRKPYDLFLFPDERHMPRGMADRIYMEERIRDYFVEHL